MLQQSHACASVGPAHLRALLERLGWTHVRVRGDGLIYITDKDVSLSRWLGCSAAWSNGAWLQGALVLS